MPPPPDDEPDDDGTVMLPSPAGGGRLPPPSLPVAPPAVDRHESPHTHTPTLNPALVPGDTPAGGNALPLGTRIGEFTLTRVIGEGGFGIVYEAHDSWLERRVAVKEYMPAELAERTDDLQVACLSEDDEELFRRGLQSFINEAKILARFDHPSLVKVYRFWEANGTAYMVMPYYEGPTLLDALRTLRRVPEEDWLLRLLDPLTHALAVIHEQHVYHRDIAPDNILLLDGSGRPLLLDFGAARRVITDANQQRAPTAIVKPGYAPVEQYSDMTMKQGPWSDVYALAAVLHYAVTGKKPPAAIARLAGDAYQPLAAQALPGFSARFLEAIDRALAVRPEERTQGMDALRADLGLPPLPRDATGLLLPAGGSQPGSEADAAEVLALRGGRTLSRVETAALRTARGVDWAAVGPSAGADAAAAEAAAGRRRRTALIAGIGLVLALAGGTAAWWWRSSGGPEVVADAGGPGNAASGTGGASGTAPGTVPGTAASPAASPATATPLGRIDVLAEFRRVRDAGTPGHDVTVTMRRPAFRIAANDILAMTVSSSHDGYLYVLAHSPDDVLLRYFPHVIVQANTVKRGVPFDVPRPVRDPSSGELHDGITLTEPAGRGHVLAIVSRYPRDFSALGQRRDSVYPIYPTGPEGAALRQRLGEDTPLYAGRPICPEGITCTDEYAAALVPFDVVP